MGEIKPLAGRIEAFATHCRIGRRSKKLRTQPRDGHVATSLPWSCAGVSIAPQRGASRSPKASGPALGASSAGGGTPPGPPGLRPLVCPSAHGHPAASVSQQEGVPGTGATVAGVGKPQACPCPTPSPSPSPLDSVFQKQGNRSVGKPQACPPEGVSPCSGGGGQTPAPPAGRLSTLGGQRGCPRPERATGRSACATRFPPAAGAPPSLRRIRGRFS